MTGRLPPGPWRASADREYDVAVAPVLDATGAEVPGLYYEVPFSERHEVASPEVLRAVLALPLLIEEARGLIAQDDRDLPMRTKRLRAVLALVDGEGRADG